MNKRVWGTLAVAAALWSVMDVTSSSHVSAAAVTIPAGEQGIIQAPVRVRISPSMEGDTLSFLSQGDKVTVLEKTVNQWYKVKTADGTIGYTSISEKYILPVGKAGVSVSGASSTASRAVAVPSAATSTNGASSATSTAGQAVATIQSAVNLRSEPANTGAILGLLSPGQQVKLLDTSNKYWFKIATDAGVTGYVGASDKFIKAGIVPVATHASSVNVNSGSGQNVAVPAFSAATVPAYQPVVMREEGIYRGRDVDTAIEQMISTGMTYLGTPYEYGSDRNSTATFDCSAFTQRIFLESMGLLLPGDSRSQGNWVRQNSQPVLDISELKRGDLVFFRDYAVPAGDGLIQPDPFSQTITHVAVYLGDSRLLHTFSVAAGGVKVTDFSQSWQDRFLYGGSVVDRVL